MANLALGLGSLQRQRHEQDLDYIMGRLQAGGEDEDMVTIISTLMKSGSLGRALQESSSTRGTKHLHYEVPQGCLYEAMPDEV